MKKRKFPMPTIKLFDICPSSCVSISQDRQPVPATVCIGQGLATCGHVGPLDQTGFERHRQVGGGSGSEGRSKALACCT